MASTSASLPDDPTSARAPFDRLTGRTIGLATLLGAAPGSLLLLFLQPPELARAVGPFVVYAGIAIALLAVARARGVDLRRLVGPIPRGREAALALGLSLAILAFSFGTLIVVLAAVAMADPGFLERFAEAAPGFVVRANGRVEWWMTLLAAGTGALVAPLVEELVFRGFLFTRWARRFGLVRGLVFSALLFAVLHLSLQPLGALTLGVVAGLLYVRTRSLWTPVIAHLANNTIVVTATTLGQNRGNPAALAPGPGELLPLLYLGGGLVLVALPLLILALLRLWPPAGATMPYDDPSAP